MAAPATALKAEMKNIEATPDMLASPDFAAACSIGHNTQFAAESTTSHSTIHGQMVRNSSRNVVHVRR